MAQNGGNAANAVASANWGGPIIADRTDLPFITVAGVDQALVGAPPFFAYTFHDRKVEPLVAGWQALAEFTLVTSTPWQSLVPGSLSKRTVTDPSTNTSVTVFTGTVVNDDGSRNSVDIDYVLKGVSGATNSGYTFTDMSGGSASNWELDNLKQAYIDERPDSLGEIVAQADEFFTYFMDLLSFNYASHPATAKVMNAASMIALFVAQYWKNQFKRVRPAELFPGLLPPIATPGHASFPSGHATQAQLIYRCLLSVLPGYGSQRTLGTAADTDLSTLARRIARNREIAGLHYPTDSAAGRTLADSIFSKILSKTPAEMPTYNGLVTAAQAEWNAP